MNDLLESDGWRIKIYGPDAGSAPPRTPPGEMLSLALASAGVSSGQSRLPVGFCILDGGQWHAGGALVGLWLVSGAVQLVQCRVRSGQAVHDGPELSLPQARILAHEIAAMSEAAGAAEAPERIGARYLADWFDGHAVAPSRWRMLATLRRFSNHWKRGDIDGLMDQMAQTPSYRTSGGACYEGREAVREGLTQMCKPSPGAAMEREDDPQGVEFIGNRSLSYWSLQLPAGEGAWKRVDGVDIITYDGDGRILLKDAYRKSA